MSTATRPPEPFVPVPYTFGPELVDRCHELRIAPAPNEALPYIRSTWCESYHRAPGNFHRRFRSWKRDALASIDRVLSDSATQVLVATSPDVQTTYGPAIVGWIVWTPGRSVSTVHYVYTRHEVGGIEWRRRGIMTALIDAAELGPRVVYTHCGEAKVGGHWKKRQLPRPLDEEIVEWIRKRGVTSVYEPIEEWWA